MRALTQTEATGWRATLRAQGRSLVFTNGVFDLLHAGHVDYLERARALGDALCVGLNSDASTRALKGPLRPVVNERDRAYLVAALRCVDAVVIYDEPTAAALVEALRPDVYAKGGDWNLSDRVPPEVAVARRTGAAIRFIPFTPEHSTTSLIARILRAYADDASRPAT
jgi:rfaE bifunctional protein nucleotidyltransferase chain/domain